ncbi:TetR/AcrR family transcriptional regulator [Mycetocola tolaasinivorans]|uniref:TetR/AcrR family transcriptional regulator n=1 Tax=Mycetocola tolaasinivorans TaxID=76635 RepID=A0A3L7A7F4_9MICO|nr:TetR/AcrR family transcriptional regulator [Mycetocola tolaasinivorans]RLP75282.1 TetR/AcrR family transcriptional regulator [Mycetocola tolaasinivorans]
MARTGNPERKTELLDQILEYLVDVPLAQASFRSLADALGVSTFALVYHFGNREQLDQEILGVVRDRQANEITGVDPLSLSGEDLIERGLRVWAEGLTRRGLLASRLAFEAGVTERLHSPEGGILAQAHEKWCRVVGSWAIAHGATQETAELESGLLLAGFTGMNYRVHVWGPAAVPTAHVEALLRRFVSQVAPAEAVAAR